MVDTSSRPRLAAVLAADVAGYTQLMERDTEGTVTAWTAARDEVIDPAVAAYFGRLVKFTGDGFLAEFPSVQDAVRCALYMQEGLAAGPLAFRMGVNLGDIVDDGRDIHGKGINVAARLESLSEPGGICISGEAHAMVRNRIDYPFIDRGEHQVKHVTQPVHVFSIRCVTSPDTPSEETAVAAVVETTASRARPSIAVLPFANMSGDAEQEYFSDGITEDLITTLSQIGHLAVMSRSAVFAFKKRDVSAQDAGRELNARYVVTGSLRKSSNRIRITAQLTDTESGENLWATRFDRDLEDIFAIQDEITLTIATALQVELTDGEQAKLRYTTTHNVKAWTSFIRGLSLFRTVSADTYRQSRACFEAALAEDQKSAQIRAMLACVHTIEGRFYWTADRGRSLRLAKEHADQALAIDADNADAWAALGYWHMSELRLDEAVASYARAVKIAPDHADLRALYALALTFAEKPDDGVREAQAAMRLNPLDPGWYCGVLGHAYRYAGRLDEALDVLSAYNQQSPGFGLVDIVLTYADRGDADKAQEYAKALLVARAEFTVATWERTQNCADPKRLSDDRQSLINAGLP